MPHLLSFMLAGSVRSNTSRCEFCSDKLKQSLKLRYFKNIVAPSSLSIFLKKVFVCKSRVPLELNGFLGVPTPQQRDV